MSFGTDTLIDPIKWIWAIESPDFGDPCEFCDCEAMYLMSIKPCGCESLICVKHHDSIMEYLAEFAKIKKWQILVCSKCNMQFVELDRMEPIRG